MIDLLLKVIDRCIDLVKRREELNRRLYTDFVEPAFADFEALHRNYLESFARYQLMIKASDVPLNYKHPIVEALADDSLFSSHLRSKLLSVFK